MEMEADADMVIFSDGCTETHLFYTELQMGIECWWSAFLLSIYASGQRIINAKISKHSRANFNSFCLKVHLIDDGR